MNNQMIYGSVCSGIEAATAGWHHLGWKPSFFSEIEPFPRAVLTHHYPTTPLHGDFTTITAGQYQPIDLLVGGTPCQAFSVAGLRKGLDDPRGNLTLAFLGLIDRLRPRWVVWENVPGVLSIDGGRTFGTFLGGLGEVGYGFAYRVLDAQWFGVAQRRRRVFVVGYLGDWRPPAAVLFERDSLHGNPAPSRKARKGTSPHVTDGSIPGSLCARTGLSRSVQDCDQGHIIPSIAGALDTECGGGKLTHQSISNGHVIGTITARMFNALGPRDVEEGALVPCFSNDPSATICANEAKTYTNEGSVFQLRNVIAEPIAIRTANTSSNGHGFSDETAYTLDRTQGQAIAVDLYNQSVSDTNQTLSSSATDASHQGAVIVPKVSMAVRRLTPVECERLQGFPDNFTRIPWRNKPANECPDGPRYKALGNSMAVPVMRWIGERIQQFEDLSK